MTKKRFVRRREWKTEWQWNNLGIIGILFVWHAIYPNPPLVWYKAIITIGINYIIAVLGTTLFVSWLDSKIIYEEI